MKGAVLNEKKPIVAINLTPLVDVSLVLVVIFMATAPMFLQSGIIVTSAAEKKAAAAGPKAAAPKNIVIRLTTSGILLNQRPIAEADLPRLLREMLSLSQDGRVIINPDREVRHGQVVRIMDLAKQNGAASLVIYGKTQAPAQRARDSKTEN